MNTAQRKFYPPTIAENHYMYYRILKALFSSLLLFLLQTLKLQFIKRKMKR